MSDWSERDRGISRESTRSSREPAPPRPRRIVTARILGMEKLPRSFRGATSSNWGFLRRRKNDLSDILHNQKRAGVKSGESRMPVANWRLKYNYIADAMALPICVF